MKNYFCKFLKKDCAQGLKENNISMDYCWICPHYGKILNPTKEEVEETKKPF